MQVRLLDFGASIRSISLPFDGGRVEAVLSYPALDDYLLNPYYLGSTLGRYANRIEQSRFRIGGKIHQLEPTPGQGGHCLHGGRVGFSHRRWDLVPSDRPGEATFLLDSQAGDQGFPGRLRVEVRYHLSGQHELSMTCRAFCDQSTVVNLANHAYFNLGDGGRDARQHLLQIHADRFAPVDRQLIPTGELAPVAGGPFDFRAPAGIGELLHEGNRQLELAGGFDHSLLLLNDRSAGEPAARLTSPATGLQLDVFTTQPCLHLYSGQYLGEPFAPFQGVCLEAQALPNAPNTPAFPGTLLRPGEEYVQTTRYRFSSAAAPGHAPAPLV